LFKFKHHPFIEHWLVLKNRIKSYISFHHHSIFIIILSSSGFHEAETTKKESLTEIKLTEQDYWKEENDIEYFQQASLPFLQPSLKLFWHYQTVFTWKTILHTDKIKKQYNTTSQPQGQETTFVRICTITLPIYAKGIFILTPCQYMYQHPAYICTNTLPIYVPTPILYMPRGYLYQHPAYICQGDIYTNTLHIYAKGIFIPTPCLYMPRGYSTDSSTWPESTLHLITLVFCILTRRILASILLVHLTVKTRSW